MLNNLTFSGYGRIAILIAIFAIVVMAVFGLITAINRRSTLRSGLRELGDPQQSAPRGGVSLRELNNESAWTRLADNIERTGLSLTDTKNDKLRAKLVSAGYNSPSAPRVFTLTRLVMLFLLPLGYVVFAYSGETSPSIFQVYFLGLIFALLGLYLPNLFVQAKADRRREEIVNGFPDCLDLLLVCVEAGLGIEAGMDRVGREMVASHPLVSELLSATTLRLRAGASREEAFRKLADSTGVDEIRSFATLLIQSDKLGTSLATTLRVYAAEMREKRRMRAEEKAHRLPVLISIPLVACMLPVMIGVLMLPAVIRVIRQLLPAMAGG